MTPATMSMAIELMRRETSSTNTMAIVEPTNAESTSIHEVICADDPTTKIMTSATTNLAPDEMPRM